MTDWKEVHKHLQPKQPLYCPQEPSLTQKVFLLSNALEAFFGGAAGGGKSSALLMAALQYVDVPGYTGILFRKTYADLALPGALMDRFLMWTKDVEEIRWNPSTYTASFPSGARLTFGYLNNVDDRLRYKCHKPDTEVLTPKGWKFINEIRVGDRVLSVNPRTRELSFEMVMNVYEYGFRGELVTTRSGSDVSFAVTPNHTCWISTQRNTALKPVEAKDLPARPFIPQTGKWTGSDRPEIGAKEYWQAIGAGNKIRKIPREVFAFEAAYCEELLHTLLDSDGAWRDKRKKNGHFVTTVRQLADDVMELATRCGYRATLNQQNYAEDHGFVPKGISYHVFLLRKRSDTATWLDTMPYKGKVYGLDVPPFHTHLIRHNGRLSYTGNSSEFQYIAMDEVTEIRESDYKYMFSRLRGPRSGPLADIPLRMRCASNPAPNWVRNRFIVEGKARGRIVVPSLLQDNPGIDAMAYRRSLEQLDFTDRQALEFGDWWTSKPGSLFRREDLENGLISSDAIPSMSARPRTVRFWDLASTEEPPKGTRDTDPDYTVGVLMMADQGVYYILDVKRARLGPAGVEKLVRDTAIEDGLGVPIRMEREPGASGKSHINLYSRKILPGFDFMGEPASGDKGLRAGPFAAAVRNRNVKLIYGDWNSAFIDELVSFESEPDKRRRHVHDDQVDASSGAFNFVAGISTKQRAKVSIIV